MERDGLNSAEIFRGMNSDEIDEALKGLEAREKGYQKNAVILRAGEMTEHVCVVLKGSVTIESNDVWGNRTILSHVGSGQCFAEAYALLPREPLLVDVTANEDCKVLFLRSGPLMATHEDDAAWMRKMIGNMLAVSLQKNLHLSGRSFHTAPKSARGRVMAYLNSVSLRKNSRDFDIPFDRQQLADYLNLERTALSKELGRMQRDGLIRTRKRHFVLL